MCVLRHETVRILFVTLCFQFECIAALHFSCRSEHFSSTGSECDAEFDNYGSLQCVLFRDTTANWQNQNTFCAGKGAQIAMFNTAAEVTELNAFSGRRDIWLRRQRDAGWPSTWSSWSIWDTNEPGGQGVCLELRNGNKLNDKSCTDSHSTICQKNWHCTPCRVCGNDERQTSQCWTTANRVCQRCWDGTYKSDATTCSGCRICSNAEIETRGCSASSNRECQQCGGTTYKSGNSCLQCTAPCSASQIQIQGCHPSHNRICNTCGSETFSTNNVCATCTGACANTHREITACTASSNRVCQICPSGSYKSAGTVCSLCTTCSAGHIQTVACTASTNRVCLQCTGDTYRLTEVSCASCLQCNVGQEQSIACSSTSNRQCQSCIPGKFKSVVGNGACSDCPLNSNSEAGASGCVCNAGFGGNDAQSCSACVLGKFKASNGNTLCKFCPETTFSFMTASIACRAVTCPAHQFSSTMVSNVARTCGNAHDAACAATINSIDTISSASHGNDGNDAGNLVHSGTVVVGTPIVFTIDFEREQIIQFIMFYNRNEDCCRGRVNGATIRIGQTGSWQGSTLCATLNSENIQRFDCNLPGRYIFLVLPVVSVGTILNFHELKAFSACTNCPQFSSSLQGSFLSSSCICNNGYVGQNGMTCSACAPGSYKTASLTCTNCPIGKYSSLPASNQASDCVLCERGKFQATTGQSQCQFCPVNQASGDGFSSCVLCGIGTYWLAETSSCTPCVGSTYKSQTGSAMCQSCVGDSVFISINEECKQLTQNCMPGYYYEGLNCVRCPKNHTTPTIPAIYYRNSCFCSPGYQRKSDVECMPCDPGFYSPDIGMSCIASPRGTFVNVDGSVMFTKCPKNWVSLVDASTSCTPCPSTSYSNSQNTLCVPGNENNLAPSIVQQFKISVFCIDVNSFGLELGFVTIEKQSGLSWNSFKNNIVQFYPNFVSETIPFSTTTCSVNYLHATPNTCGVNMFMMRMHSYIWECVSCPTGTYKDTLSLLYTDCKECSDNLCPELKQTCNAIDAIYIMPSNPMYTNYFKYDD